MSPRVPDRELLAAARSGNQEAFRSLVEPHCPSLHAHCYRMLGSFHDAEDAFQNALLRAWRGLPGFEGRSTLKSWLYRIATNACIDAIARRPRRVLPVDFDAAPDVVPQPAEDEAASPEARFEQREELELAFAAALQHLAPRQRAVIVLRDALGFSAQEASESLGTTVPSVHSALQRARRAAEQGLPERSRQPSMRLLEDRRLRERVGLLVDAFERGDVEAIVELAA